MGKYDIYDDKGSRKGEIRDNEFGREGMDIFDDRGSKIGEIKPHYSVSDSSGGGCALILVGSLLILLIIATPIVYFKQLAEDKDPMMIVHFIAEVIACVVCVTKLRKMDGGFINDFIISMIITGIVGLLVMIVEMIIMGQLSLFIAIFLSILCCVPFALISSLIVWFIRIRE